MIGGHSGRGRWRGQEGRAFQRRETGKKEADVHGMEKSAKGKPVAMIQGNRQGSSRERWCGKPCRAGESGSTKKRQGAAQCDCTGKAMRECPEGGRAQGKRREGDWALPRRKIGKKRGWGMRHWETNGRALESGGAGKLTERRREGPCRKIGKRGVRATARENRGKGTGRGGTGRATGALLRGDGAGTPVSRRRGSKTGQKAKRQRESGRLPRSATARSSVYLAGPDGPPLVPTGRSTVKAMRPPPLSARISPPWRCTMSRAMASPSPAPPVAVCREASSR